jgi:hypothetical protein
MDVMVRMSQQKYPRYSLGYLVGFYWGKNTIYHIYPHLSNVAMLGFFPDLHSKMWHGQVGWYTEYTGDGRQSMTFLETHGPPIPMGFPFPWNGMG